MSKKSQTTPANHTRTAQQLADRATLIGLMQSASKFSQELDVLANQVGGSLEKIAGRLGVPWGCSPELRGAADHSHNEAEGQQAAQASLSSLIDTIRPSLRH